MSTIDTSPFADDVRAVAARYGVAEQDVVPVPVQGQVNWTAYLGDELVVRIPRTSRGSEQLLKEAAVIPVARDAGVPTPALVDVDSTLRLASSPYMVLERVRGTTLTEKTLDPAQRRRALASLGEVLAALHEVRRSRVGSVGAIPAPYTFSPTEVVERLVDAGEIGSGQSDWLLEQFSLLQPEGPSISDPVLLHRDVIPSNVMVDQGGRSRGTAGLGLRRVGIAGPRSRRTADPGPARSAVRVPLSTRGRVIEPRSRRRVRTREGCPLVPPLPGAGETPEGPLHVRGPQLGGAEERDTGRRPRVRRGCGRGDLAFPSPSARGPLSAAGQILAGLADDTAQRTSRSRAMMPAATSSGFCQAAKCPPSGSSSQERMSR